LSKKLNLANKPFTNRALPWTVTIVLVTFSVVAMIWIVSATSERKAQAKIIQTDINRLNKEKQEVEQHLQEVQNSFTPDQLLALKSAHELVDRKRFSWSRLFGDLEAALPNGVRVAHIGVRHVSTQSGQTVADLELTVIAATSTTVTEMIGEMDRDGVFKAEINTQNVQKGRGETGSEYELMVHYTPRASFASSVAEGPRAALENSMTQPVGGPR
jgi:Tfp pilus assembly protein PilN